MAAAAAAMFALAVMTSYYNTRICTWLPGREIRGHVNNVEARADLLKPAFNVPRVSCMLFATIITVERVNREQKWPWSPGPDSRQRAQKAGAGQAGVVQGGGERGKCKWQRGDCVGLEWADRGSLLVWE